VRPYCCICVLINILTLLYVLIHAASGCPHTPTYVSSYVRPHCSICFLTNILILAHMCPHTCGHHRRAVGACGYWGPSQYLYFCTSKASKAPRPHSAPAPDGLSALAYFGEQVQREGGVLYLLYWYKSTNTDSSTLTPASRCRERGRGCCWCACFIWYKSTNTALFRRAGAE
jgi:hypothetical protein